MHPDHAKTILDWMEDADRKDDEDCGMHYDLTLPAAVFRALKTHLRAMLSRRTDDPEICCFRCDHDFTWPERDDGACPNCGLRFTWECSQGHDHVEFCSPLWENE